MTTSCDGWSNNLLPPFLHALGIITNVCVIVLWSAIKAMQSGGRIKNTLGARARKHDRVCAWQYVTHT